MRMTLINANSHVPIRVPFAKGKSWAIRIQKIFGCQLPKTLE